VLRWNTANGTDLSKMFSGCRLVNSDVSGWNVDNATNLNSMQSVQFRCVTMERGQWHRFELHVQRLRIAQFGCVAMERGEWHRFELHV
jgi:surface protein